MVERISDGGTMTVRRPGEDARRVPARLAWSFAPSQACQREEL